MRLALIPIKVTGLLASQGENLCGTFNGVILWLVLAHDLQRALCQIKYRSAIPLAVAASPQPCRLSMRKVKKSKIPSQAYLYD